MKKQAIHNFLIQVAEKDKIKLKNGLELFLPVAQANCWLGTVISTPISTIKISPDYVASRLGEQIRFLPTVKRAIHNLRMSKLKKWLLTGRKYLGFFSEKDFIFEKKKNRVTLHMDNSMSEIKEGDTVYFKGVSDSGKIVKNYMDFIAGERNGDLYVIGNNVIINLTTDTEKMPNGLYLPTEMQKNPNVGIVVEAPSWAKCKKGDFIRVKSIPALFFIGDDKNRPFYYVKYSDILIISKTKEGVGESKRFFDKKNHYEH